MVQKRLRVPGRPVSFEAGLLACGLLTVVALGCAETQPGALPSAEDELKRSLGLGPSAVVHRVSLGGRGSEEHAVPSLIEATPGDAVVFETVDHRVHTVSFVTEGLPLRAEDFLERQSALSSLPLVTKGSSFVVILDEAPPGSYPFISEGHGGQARGVLRVTSPEDSVQGVGG